VKYFLSNKCQIYNNENYFANYKESKYYDNKNMSTIKLYGNINLNDRNDNYRTNEETIRLKDYLSNKSGFTFGEDSLKNTISIYVNKNLANQVESRFKLIEFQKLSPKFLKTAESSCTASQILNQDTYTNDIEMLEIDGKLPQAKLNQNEERINRVNIYKNFPYHYFFEQEK